MQEGLKHLGSGKNAISVKNGIMKAVDAVVKHLETQAQPVSKKAEFAAVATISAQDPEIGSLIAEVIDEVGKDGVVTVEAGQTLGLEKEFVEGMQFDQGYISAYFVTDSAGMKAVFERPSILITDKKISSIQEILPLLESMAQRGKKELVIIAESVEGEALATLVLNKLRGTFNTLAIKAPAFGDRRKEMLKDIAILTGGRVITEEIGLKLENATFEDLGTARRVMATKDNCTIVDGSGKKTDIAARVNELKTMIADTKSDFDREKLQERLAKLSGGVAIIKVGAATELEQKEKQHRVEDALSATRAAAEEGIVAGGGTAFIRAISALEKLKVSNDDEQSGVDIVRNALTWPARHIAENAGVEGHVVVEKVRMEKGNVGYNAMTATYEDLVKSMVIDPKKVTRSALENAASVAAMFLTLEVAITDIPEKEKPAMPGGGGMDEMGGMGGMGGF